MTDRDEWIADRVAMILEGNTFSLGLGRWACRRTEQSAVAQAVEEYEQWLARQTNETNDDEQG